MKMSLMAVGSWVFLQMQSRLITPRNSLYIDELWVTVHHTISKLQLHMVIKIFFAATVKYVIKQIGVRGFTSLTDLRPDPKHITIKVGIITSKFHSISLELKKRNFFKFFEYNHCMGS